jgi:NAD(P) transhydrogenase subunit alpha
VPLVGLHPTTIAHSAYAYCTLLVDEEVGIIIVGAVLLAGSGNIIVTVLSFIAMTIAAINIFGGFLVTDRMLKMFERSSE